MTKAKPFTLAVDVGGSHLTVAIVSENGVEARRDLPAAPHLGLRPLLPEIERAARDLLVALPEAAGACTGIGMAVPLLVDSRRARVLSSPRGKYEDASGIDFRGWAAERLDLPLELEVDAHAGCLGEWRYGAGRGCDDLVFVTLGTGYGTSVVLRGRSLRGRSGLAGVLGGHLTVNAGGRPCVCPGRGCIEAETGTWALPGILREEPGFAASRLARYDRIDYRILFTEADLGDPLARRMVDRSLASWAASLVNLTHAYDPAKIVMAGGVMQAADRILPFMNDFIRSHAWTAADPPAVVAARFCDSAALMGGRALFTGPAALL